MRKVLMFAIGSLIAFDLTTGSAWARGGGSNLMNSPGYQRRLQESRGYVTHQSGSIFQTTAPVVVRKSVRGRHQIN